LRFTTAETEAQLKALKAVSLVSDPSIVKGVYDSVEDIVNL
jgi:hypothetical protein